MAAKINRPRLESVFHERHVTERKKKIGLSLRMKAKKQKLHTPPKVKNKSGVVTQLHRR
jgi:hypothetical protein